MVNLARCNPDPPCRGWQVWTWALDEAQQGKLETCSLHKDSLELPVWERRDHLILRREMILTGSTSMLSQSSASSAQSKAGMKQRPIWEEEKYP
jgi:hypothetical protein